MFNYVDDFFSFPTASNPDELHNKFAPIAPKTPHEVKINAENATCRALGNIICWRVSHINNKNDFVASAIFIAPNIVLTARHVLNGFVCSDLIFIYNDIVAKQTKVSGFSVLEDGANFGQDYALLYIHKNFGEPICFTFELPAENSLFACVKLSRNGINGMEIITAEAPKRPPQQTLLFESYLKSSPGFSGTPYINENGQMFGLHLSGYEEHSVWNGVVTGISLALFREQSDKSSFLYQLLSGNFSFPPIPHPEYFFDDDFFITLASLGQIDEGAREAALGATPKLDTLTGTQVLLRYFLKEKAKLKNNHNYTNNQINFLLQWKNNWRKYTQSYFSYRSLTEIGVDETKDDYRKLYNLLLQISEWEILLKMPLNGNLNQAKHEWRPLNMKKKKMSDVAGVQMGHKMGAVDYWAYGAGDRKTKGSWLRDERIPEIKPSKYNTPQKINEKIQTLEKRYINYKSAGYKDYKPNTKDRTFMKEYWNYHFQWWEINQRDGRIAGQKTKYKDYTPANYQWQGSKLV